MGTRREWDSETISCKALVLKCLRSERRLCIAPFQTKKKLGYRRESAHLVIPVLSVVPDATYSFPFPSNFRIKFPFPPIQCPHLIISILNHSPNHSRHAQRAHDTAPTVWYGPSNSLLHSFEAWPVGHTTTERCRGLRKWFLNFDYHLLPLPCNNSHSRSCFPPAPCPFPSLQDYVGTVVFPDFYLVRQTAIWDFA